MKKVCAVGAAIVDILVSGADERVFRTGSMPADNILMSHGGDALNEAIVLKHLGVPVHLEALVGDDAAGQSVLQRMERAGLDTSGIHIKQDMSTSVNVVLVSPDGERSFLTNPRGSQRRLRSEDIHIPADTDILSFASIFVFPEMGPAEMAELFREAKERGITVCADMTKRKKGETVAELACALRHVDYLFPNAEEAMLLTGAESVESAADALFAAGVGTVIIKCGKDGCHVRTASGTFRVPAERNVNCVDTTGAGDSFAGGFISGLAAGKGLEECLEIANRCGARAVEKFGATAWTEG